MSKTVINIPNVAVTNYCKCYTIYSQVEQMLNLLLTLLLVVDLSEEEFSHCVVKMTRRVTDVHSCLLFIPSQHPDLGENNCRKCELSHYLCSI